MELETFYLLVGENACDKYNDTEEIDDTFIIKFDPSKYESVVDMVAEVCRDMEGYEDWWIISEKEYQEAKKRRNN